jgi:hypothetical protein
MAMIERARAVRIEDEIARRGLRFKRQGGELVGPCPKCGGRDRFAVNIRKQIFNCRGCQRGGDVITLCEMLDGGDFSDAVSTLVGELTRHPAVSFAPRQQRHDNECEARMRAIAGALWDRRRPSVGSPVERYLREARGYGGDLPASIGYLPAGKHPPAMIARFGLDPVIECVHLTVLVDGGRDRCRGDHSKRFIGTPSAGRTRGPIVLAEPNDGLALALTEGIENALSIHEALGIGAWAAGSGGMLPALAPLVPTYIETVLLEQDPDDTGRRATRELASLLADRGFEVIIREVDL